MPTKREVIDRVLSTIRTMDVKEYDRLYESIKDREDVHVFTQGFEIELSFNPSIGTSVFDYRNVSREFIEIQPLSREISYDLRISLAA